MSQRLDYVFLDKSATQRKYGARKEDKAPLEMSPLQVRTRVLRVWALVSFVSLVFPLRVALGFLVSFSLQSAKRSQARDEHEANINGGF